MATNRHKCRHRVVASGALLLVTAGVRPLLSAAALGYGSATPSLHSSARWLPSHLPPPIAVLHA